MQTSGSGDTFQLLDKECFFYRGESAHVAKSDFVIVQGRASSVIACSSIIVQGPVGQTWHRQRSFVSTCGRNDRVLQLGYTLSDITAKRTKDVGVDAYQPWMAKERMSVMVKHGPDDVMCLGLVGSERYDANWSSGSSDQARRVPGREMTDHLMKLFDWVHLIHPCEKPRCGLTR